MQTLIIGDIHGCYVELLALLEKAGLNAGDSILAVGDIVIVGQKPRRCWTFSSTCPMRAP